MNYPGLFHPTQEFTGIIIEILRHIKKTIFQPHFSIKIGTGLDEHINEALNSFNLCPFNFDL